MYAGGIKKINMDLDLKIILATITGVSGLLVAIYNSIVTFQSQKKIEFLKQKLDEEKAEKNARRDYEYEAKKKLYQEYEPLLFRLTESSEGALSRILGLCRTARNENLEKDGWLSKEGYYLSSTFYYLFYPMAIFKLIKQKINLIDLSFFN